MTFKSSTSTRRFTRRGAIAAATVSAALLVSAPAALARPQPRPPRGATAQCRDGTYSLSRSRSTACWGHGGVSRWLR
jgi:hypothetical protein